MQAIPATLEGATVKVIGVNLGWATVQDNAGAERKVRVSKLEVDKDALSGLKPRDMDTNRSKASLLDQARAKRGGAKKAKAKPKREEGRLVQPDLTKYMRHQVKTASGNYAIDIDDDAAARLRGKDLNEQYEIVAKALTKAGEEVSARSLKARYGHLNIGMQRMNLGNRLRKILSATA